MFEHDLFRRRVATFRDHAVEKPRTRPAPRPEGLWTEDGKTSHDEIVIFEVMADELDRGWWSAYRAELERRFRQDVIVIRAQTIEQL